MSTGRNNLNLQGRGVSHVWYGKQPVHLFQYRPFLKSGNHVKERFDVSPVSTTNLAYGKTIKFELDKRGDLLYRLVLIITRSASTVATDSFDDYEGYASVDVVRFSYSNKTFFEIRGDELRKFKDQYMTEEERDAAASQQFGGRTLPERVTNAGSAYTWAMDLCVPWTDINKHIPMIAMPNKVNVDVTFRPIAECLRGSGTATISTALLRSYYVHVPQSVRTGIFHSINSGDGVAVKIMDSEFHLEETIAAATTKFTLNIRNIKNDVVALELIFRLQSSLKTQASIDRGAYTLPSRFWIEDNGQRVTDKIDASETTFGQNGLYGENNEKHPYGRVGVKIPSISFCPHELLERSFNDCYGSRNFVKYNNPVLVVEFDTATAAAILLDVWAYRHNLLVYQKGDIRAYLI